MITTKDFTSYLVDMDVHSDIGKKMNKEYANIVRRCLSGDLGLQDTSSDDRAVIVQRFDETVVC